MYKNNSNNSEQSSLWLRCLNNDYVDNSKENFIYYLGRFSKIFLWEKPQGSLDIMKTNTLGISVYFHVCRGVPFQGDNSWTQTKQSSRWVFFSQLASC